MLLNKKMKIHTKSVVRHLYWVAQRHGLCGREKKKRWLDCNVDVRVAAWLSST